MFAGGIITQALKHLTARESPFSSIQNRGKWKFFPNQKEYSKHVPHYDAFPSGHIATLMGAVTIISDNYPEYRFIRPAGYALCGLLGFAMVNNGVHWVSDYPLELAIGYVMGKAIVAKVIWKLCVADFRGIKRIGTYDLIVLANENEGRKKREINKLDLQHFIRT